MSEVLKKRLRVGSRDDQCTTPHKEVMVNHFDKDDWKKWLVKVSNFYKQDFVHVSPLFLNKHLDNRPYVKLKLFDQDIVALFDSGATTSVVGSLGLKILDRCHIKIKDCTLKNICTADGTPKIVKGVVDLPIFINDHCQIITALVVPSLPHSFIFGCNFAKQFELLVDFKENSWQIQSNISKTNISVVDRNNEFENYSKLCSIDDLSVSQRNIAQKVIDSFNEICSKDRLGRTNKITLSIDTGEEKPFRKRPFVMSPYMSNILNNELDDMLKLGVVERSQSPWCSPVLLVKKSNGEYRFCFDGRPLNEITRHDCYPLPNIERILNSLRDAKYISSIDLRKAFWQIPLDEASKEKTAFSIVGRGQFQWVTMPYGLRNAAQAQQRLVDAIFGPTYEPKIFSYIDDIIITGSTFEEHVQLLQLVKDKLKEANLTINLEKCKFFKTSLKFLGYIVGSNSLRTDPEKVSSMLNYPRPRTATEIKRFVGLCSWYRRFLKDFSTLLSPITDLLKGKKKSQTITWTDDAENSFLKIKELLVSAPILTQPDFSKEFSVQSDASNTGLGAVLSQVIDGEERVIAYASRSLSRTERNYSSVERELLGILFAIEKFRPYVEGTKFKVITDCYSLLWLNNLKNPSGRLARWSVRLRQHNFDLIHRKGANNVVPDALSRIPDSVIEIASFNIDIDRIDPWYDQLRSKILDDPNKYPQWKVENDFILKYIPSHLPVNNNIIDWKYLVPKPQRIEIIKSCHDLAISSHLGFYKTLNRVQERFYWPKMRRDIVKYVRNCNVCESQKFPNSKQMGLMGREKICRVPFQIIGLDLIGPLPLSKNGNRYILVISDWFSKYSLLFPLRDATSKHIEKHLENDLFLVFGVPEIVICDNGPQFVGKAFRDLCRAYEVKKIWHNAVYSPQVNFVERNNRTIETALRCFVGSHREWDKEIFKIQQALNTARHEVTGFSPAFLVFGRHIPLSGNYFSQNPIENDLEITPGDRTQYAVGLKDIKDVFCKVRERLHIAYGRNMKSYNLRKRDAEFNVGDKVWRLNKVLSNAANRFSAKLAPRYILSEVSKKFSKLVYELIDSNGNKAGKWHIKDLKPYRGSDNGSDLSADSSEE
jgi:RNase H-like domain found in reverse transcriptase/Reverse transcriptase (RNA-dependent DNA polymerase)/Integrase zinc binding domain/Integrase core domain